LTPPEKEAIIAYHAKNPLNGYRRLCYMMIDEDVVYCSPNSVYRALKEAGVLDKAPPTGGCKGQGFNQPTRINQHWHVDISYLNVCGTFYYLCSVLDGFSRYIIHHEIRESMTEDNVEIIVQKAVEKSIDSLVESGISRQQATHQVKPRVISDRGPQFIAKDFKQFIRLSGMTHVKTSPYYPQSNGKIERWHREMKTSYRSKEVSSFDQAKMVVNEFVDEYNHYRLHSALGYTTPYDRYLGLDIDLKSERQKKLREAALKRTEYWHRKDQKKRCGARLSLQVPTVVGAR
jgi:putative transposase